MDARTPFTDSVAFQSCSYSMRQLAAMDDYAYAISNGYGYGNSVSGRGMMICGADWIGAVDQTGGLPAVDSRLEYAGFGQAPSPSVEQQAAAIIRGVAASHGRQPAAVRTGGKTTVPRGSNIGPDFRGNTALNVDISRLPLEGEPKKVDTRGAEVNARAALPWQIRRQLGEGCIGQAFTVSPVDPWDPDSAAILWEHYSQYGPVARVLVAHSDDNLANVSWSDTGAGMAAVVMVNQSDVDSIMAVGSIQHLHGKCVFVAKIESVLRGGHVPFGFVGAVGLIASQLRLDATATRAQRDLDIRTGIVSAAARSQASSTADSNGQQAEGSGDSDPPSSSPTISRRSRQTEAGQYDAFGSTARPGSPGPSGSSGSEEAAGGVTSGSEQVARRSK